MIFLVQMWWRKKEPKECFAISGIISYIPQFLSHAIKLIFQECFIVSFLMFNSVFFALNHP